MEFLKNSHYYNWFGVLFFVVLYGMVLFFLPFYKKVDKKPTRTYLAFVIAFAIEMHGIPFSMYVISWIVGKSLPEGILWGHTFISSIGYFGMYINMGCAAIAMVLIISGWQNIYKKYWSKETGNGSLVKSGVYRYIRHPQYTGLLLLSFGMMIEWVTLPLLILYPIMIHVYVRLAKKEEQDMLLEFGDEYREYMKETKMFVPFWSTKPCFLLSLITAVILLLYVIVMRPYLMPTMKTVPIELGFGIILILSLVVAIATFIITILITAVIAVYTSSKAKIMIWLLKLRKQLVVIVALLFVNIISILCSQWMAYTPPIRNYKGEPVVDSIAVLEKVTLGDSEQWITIRGKNKNNPVLLFLAGGPGGSQLAATREELIKLEEDYVVVNWDQPGAGKSMKAMTLKSITPKRYISDGLELTKYLCKRFNQEKIYVLGESWGSTLGILLVQRYPELFYAFVGTGQMVEFVETDVRMYELVLNIAKERGDALQIEKMKNQGLPPYYGKGMIWKFSTLSQYLAKYMTKNPEIERPGYNTLSEIGGAEYGLYDKVSWILGLVTTFNHVYPQLYNIDLRKQAIKLDVPVYFMVGRHDVNSSPEMAEDYFNAIEAPHKEFIWFEHSGHDSWRNEPDKLVDLMVNVVLKREKIK